MSPHRMAYYMDNVAVFPRAPRPGTGAHTTLAHAVAWQLAKDRSHDTLSVVENQAGLDGAVMLGGAVQRFNTGDG